MPRTRLVTALVINLTIAVTVSAYFICPGQLARIFQRPVVVAPNLVLEPLPVPTTDSPNLEKEFLCNSPAITWGSLITMAEKQLAYVKSIVPDAELFEMQATVLPTEVVKGNIDIRSPSSDFALLADDTRYIRVEENKDLYMKVDEDRLRPGYVQSVCRIELNNFVASRGQEPIAWQGQADNGLQMESHDYHLPIRNWKIDVMDIARILKSTDAVREEFLPVLHVTISSLGRARHTGSFVNFISANTKLSKLSDIQAIVEIDMPQSSKGGFWILDAESGEILGDGTGLYSS